MTTPATTTSPTNALTNVANALTPATGKLTGQQETLSTWAGPYVTQMLGKTQALADQPYQVYQGPLTAGASPLQMQAFQGIGGLRVPESVGQAATDALSIGQAAKGMSFTPGSFANTFTAPTGYTAGAFDAGFNFSPTRQATGFSNQFTAPDDYQGAQFKSGFNYQAPTGTTQFTNQFQAPTAFQAGEFQGGIFGTPQAQQYMNPFLQTALTPTLDEMRRQAEMSRTQQAGRLAQAGAFGGSRQAIMESELNRNLMESQRKAIGEGYATAYDRAAAQYNADMARAMEAQRMGEQSRQFGASQGMTAAQLQAQYGLSAQQAQEAARQFNAGQALTAAQLQAQFGLDAQKAAEMSRQFGAQQAMTGAQERARFGLEALRGTESARQFDLGQQLAAAQESARMRLDAQRAAEASRQFGAGQAMTAAQEAARYGLDAARMGEQSRQFGAQYGLSGLAQQLDAARALGVLGQTLGAEQRANLGTMLGAGATQRGIESEGVAADLAEFERQRDYPYKMLQFQQSLLQGLPIQSVAASYQQPSAASRFANTTGGLMSLFQEMFGGK